MSFLDHFCATLPKQCFTPGKFSIQYGIHVGRDLKKHEDQHSAQIKASCEVRRGSSEMYAVRSWKSLRMETASSLRATCSGAWLLMKCLTYEKLSPYFVKISSSQLLSIMYLLGIKVRPSSSPDCSSGSCRNSIRLLSSHHCGNFPDFCDLSKMLDSGLLRTPVSSLSTLKCSSSGPMDLSRLSSLKQSLT